MKTGADFHFFSFFIFFIFSCVHVFMYSCIHVFMYSFFLSSRRFVFSSALRDALGCPLKSLRLPWPCALRGFRRPRCTPPSPLPAMDLFLMPPCPVPCTVVVWRDREADGRFTDNRNRRKRVLSPPFMSSLPPILFPFYMASFMSARAGGICLGSTIPLSNFSSWPGTGHAGMSRRERWPVFPSAPFTS
jgi:hypothetical protein